MSKGFGPEAKSIMLPCDHHGNPASYVVGMYGVTRIENEVLNYGDHGLSVMHVYEGENITLTAPLKECAFVEWA